MATGRLGLIDNQRRIESLEGTWLLDDDDWALIAQLQDPVFCAELLFEDPLNTDYGGTYVVRPYQYPLFRPRRNYNIAPCARDVGKSLASGEPVLRPDGSYAPIGDLEPGDLVVGSDGRPTLVMGVYPQGVRDIYRVTFKDGTHVDCDAEHLWQVTCDTWDRRGIGPRVLPLSEIMVRRARFRVALPTAPVEFTPREHYEQDPWLVGALLGDGNLTRPTMVRFSSPDEEVLERFRRALPDDAELVRDGRYDYRVRARERVYAGWGKRQPCELLAWSRRAGLHGLAAHEKHVPTELLRGSVRERLEVLRGLADTDGSVTRFGLVEISTASKRLAADVKFIVGSLGGRASVNRGPTPRRDRWRVVFCLPGFTPFHLDRKRQQYEQRNAQRQSRRHSRIISKIDRVGRRHATCIAVAADDGLFMTRDMVLTHNTESIKARAVSHAFRRMGEDMLLSAPQLIHLDPLTQQVEYRLVNTRLTRDFLKRDAQKTGITHKPFQVDFLDGTRIIGRIPHIDGKGVKGQHVVDLIIDEAQDYSEGGWTEVFPTVMKDHTGPTGAYDFSMTFYGVHGAGQGGTFGRLAKSSSYSVTNITRLQTPNWGKEEKDATAAMYGGTNSPDYRRNVLGEPGQAFNQFFATARLIACMDQDPDSRYNTTVFQAQELQAEEVDKTLGIARDPSELIDLPENLGQQVYCGMDVGLVNDPTVIMVFAIMPDQHRKQRLQLVRMLHLWRFREKQIRQVTYRIARQYGLTLRGFGQDITGLGLPLYQAMEDDEECPTHLKEVAQGYTFNAKVPVSVDKNYVSEQGQQLVDQYGHIVEVLRDKWTGAESLVARMTMIEASTRYLRGFIDTGFLLLPFHDKLIADFQGETEQRVKAIGLLKKRPGGAFHMLDAARAFAMGYKHAEIEEQVYARPQQPVFDRAVTVAA